MSISSSAICLPIVTVQHDFQNVISDVREGIVPSEHFWVSCYKLGETSVHGKVRVHREEGSDGAAFEAKDGVQLGRMTGGVYTISCSALSIPRTRLRGPQRVFGEVSREQISAFDVAPDTSLMAKATSDGSVIVQALSPSSTPLTVKPHLSTILSLRFFPSSQVLLSSSSDLTVAITSALDGTIPRKLKGHSRGVTDTAIISRGKNVLSCGKDGTIRLWDVGGGSQIRVMGSESYSPILKLALGEMTPESTLLPPDGHQSPAPSVNPKEVDTGGKLVFAALQNGTFNVIDLGSKTLVHKSHESHKGPGLHSIAYSSTHSLVATGSAKGVVTIYDTRQLSDPLFSFQRNGACVEDLAFASSGNESNNEAQIVIGTEDGLPYRASVRPQGPEVVEELVGYDCDAVRVVRVSGGSVWTAGDDGVVRKY